MDDASTRKYHVAHQGRKFGPLSLVQLSSRRLSSDMLVWCEGMPEWIPVGDIPELRPYVHHATASHTVAPPTTTSAMMPATSASSASRGKVTASPSAGAGPPSMPPQPPAPPAGSLGRIKFLGITTIILSCVGLVCCPVTFFAVVAIDQAAAGDGAATLSDAGWGVVRNLLISGDILVSIPMLAAGIGLLYRRRWAAITTVFTSVTCILLNLGSSVIECLGGLPLLENAGSLEGGQEIGALVGCIVGMLAYLAGMIWHATAIFLLNSASVRQGLR